MIYHDLEGLVVHKCDMIALFILFEVKLVGVIGLKAGLSIPLFHLKHKVGAYFYFNTIFVSGAYKLI